MEDIAFMSAVAEVGFTAAAYSQMPGGISVGFSSLNTNNFVFFLTLAHAVTGRALLQYRLGRSTIMEKVNDHAIRHFLAVLSLGMSYMSLIQSGNWPSLSSTLLMTIQGVYILTGIVSAIFTYMPRLFPDAMLSQFLQAHMWFGKVFWWIHSIQVIYTHYHFGKKAGSLGCWMWCAEGFQTLYHMALICTVISSFSIHYVLTNRPPPHVHLKEAAKEA
ncbi:unnamed protein product, partial [Mesorhabditis spiculigera]